MSSSKLSSTVLSQSMMQSKQMGKLEYFQSRHIPILKYDAPQQPEHLADSDIIYQLPKEYLEALNDEEELYIDQSMDDIDQFNKQTLIKKDDIIYEDNNEQFSFCGKEDDSDKQQQHQQLSDSGLYQRIQYIRKQDQVQFLNLNMSLNSVSDEFKETISQYSSKKNLNSNEKNNHFKPPIKENNINDDNLKTVNKNGSNKSSFQSGTNKENDKNAENIQQSLSNSKVKPLDLDYNLQNSSLLQLSKTFEDNNISNYSSTKPQYEQNEQKQKINKIMITDNKQTEPKNNNYQTIDNSSLVYSNRVLSSDFLTSGPQQTNNNTNGTQNRLFDNLNLNISEIQSCSEIQLSNFCLNINNNNNENSNKQIENRQVQKDLLSNFNKEKQMMNQNSQTKLLKQNSKTPQDSELYQSVIESYEQKIQLLKIEVQQSTEQIQLIHEEYLQKIKNERQLANDLYEKRLRNIESILYQERKEANEIKILLSQKENDLQKQKVEYEILLQKHEYVEQEKQLYVQKESQKIQWKHEQELKYQNYLLEETIKREKVLQQELQQTKNENFKFREELNENYHKALKFQEQDQFVKNQKDTIQQLKAALNDSQMANELLISDLKSQNKILQSQLSDVQQRYELQFQQNINHINIIDQLQSSLISQDQKFGDKQKLREFEQLIEDLKQKNQDLFQQNQTQESEISFLKTQQELYQKNLEMSQRCIFPIKEKDCQSDYLQEIQKLSELINEKDQIIQNLQAQLDQSDKQKYQLLEEKFSQTVENLKSEHEEKMEQLRIENQQIFSQNQVNWNNQVQQLNDEVLYQNMQLQLKQNQINQYESELGLYQDRLKKTLTHQKSIQCFSSYNEYSDSVKSYDFTRKSLTMNNFNQIFNNFNHNINNIYNSENNVHSVQNNMNCSFTSTNNINANHNLDIGKIYQSIQEAENKENILRIENERLHFQIKEKQIHIDQQKIRFANMEKNYLLTIEELRKNIEKMMIQQDLQNQRFNKKNTSEQQETSEDYFSHQQNVFDSWQQIVSQEIKDIKPDQNIEKMKTSQTSNLYLDRKFNNQSIKSYEEYASLNSPIQQQRGDINNQQ